MNFTKPKKAIGLDIGTHAVKAVQMSRHGSKLSIDDVGYALVDHNQVNVDPVGAQADALREALRRISTNNSMLVGALPGQTVVIRYPRLRDVAPDQIDDAIQEEASQNIPYDLAEVFLDWSLLDEENEGDDTLLKVLLVAAKNEVIDSRVQIASQAEIGYSMLSVDSLALADAAEGCQLFNDDETVALVNIGASSVSIHFTRDGISNFIRDVSWGAREMINAIAKSRRCDFEEAEAILYNLNEEIVGQAEAETPPAMPEAQTEVPGAEALSSLDEELGMTPPPLNPTNDGASLLEPLAEEIDSLDSLGDEPVPVQPQAVEENAEEIVHDTTPLNEIIAQPISRLVAEVRRSFDYYEHQLYERPVDRIILSGGVAHIPNIASALSEDLDIENVSVADPSASDIKIRRTGVPEFEEHPAQFMVAVGLAARGVAEL